MARLLPGEVGREVSPPGTREAQDDPNYVVTITGAIIGEGKGLNEDDANRAAEREYDKARSALALDGQSAHADVDEVAAVLYAYHHAVVLNASRGFPPGTPLPHAAAPGTKDHFRREAELWLGKVRGWATAAAPDPTDTSKVRGEPQRVL